MMSSPPLDGTILITGASAGIGRELARQMATTAGTIVLVARRRDRLEQLRDELSTQHPSLSVHIFSCDLGSELARNELLAALQEAVGTVDILVNNAGFGDQCFFERSDWEKLDQMFRLNITALTHLTHALLPAMLERRRGAILNISSILGISYVPGLAAYAGTKHYVTAFSDCLRAELAGTGVSVTQVCPGPVATEFASVANNTTSLRTPKMMEISAAQCAQQSLAGFRCGKAMVFPGMSNRVVASLSSLLPRWVFRAIHQRLGKQLRNSPLIGKTNQPENQPDRKPTRREN